MFGTEAVLPVVQTDEQGGEAYWKEAEKFRRNLLGKKLPAEYFTQRDEIQNRWIARAAQLSNEDFPAFSKECIAEEGDFLEKWRNIELEAISCVPGFAKRWENKNQLFFHE